MKHSAPNSIKKYARSLFSLTLKAVPEVARNLVKENLNFKMLMLVYFQVLELGPNFKDENIDTDF